MAGGDDKSPKSDPRNELFMVWGPRNAMNSKWVPREIGVADVVKGNEKVLIVPVADPNGQFHGNEYLQIYRKVEWSDLGKLIVSKPTRAYVSTLRSLLESKAKPTHHVIYFG